MRIENWLPHPDNSPFLFFNGKRLISHLRRYLEDIARGLGVGVHGDFLILLPYLAFGVKRDGDIALLAGSYAPARIVGYGAATGGRATADDQIGIARVAEMETVGDALALGDAAKVVQFLVERHHRHTGRIVIALSAVWVVDKIHIDVAAGRAVATACRKHQQREEWQ